MKKSFQKLIIFALILGLVCGPVSCGALPKKGAKASSGNSSSVQASESTVAAVPYSEPQAPRAILDMPSSGASSAPAPGSSASGGSNSGSGRNSTPRKITVCMNIILAKQDIQFRASLLRQIFVIWALYDIHTKTPFLFGIEYILKA